MQKMNSFLCQKIQPQDMTTVTPNILLQGRTSLGEHLHNKSN